jgi:S1-C subfamily serine protease
MGWRWLLLLLVLNLETTGISLAETAPACPGASVSAIRPTLSDQQIEQLAKSITVRVISPAVVGSGVIVGRQGHNYQVLTNAHNLLGTDRAQVQTSDGSYHSARRSPRRSWGKKDLVLLEFQTSNPYQAADWSPRLATPGLEVVAIGFGFDRQAITVSSGKVAHLLEKPLRSGYQLGYTSPIQQGMSGGPILDRTGLLLGVNAMSAYPLLNSAYRFADGSRPSSSTIRELRRFNWGIPLKNGSGCLDLAKDKLEDYSPTLD